MKTVTGLPDSSTRSLHSRKPMLQQLQFKASQITQLLPYQGPRRSNRLASRPIHWKDLIYMVPGSQPENPLSDSESPNVDKTDADRTPDATTPDSYPITPSSFLLQRLPQSTSATVREALPDQRWLAMNEELDALNRNRTWDLVGRTPHYGMSMGIYHVCHLSKAIYVLKQASGMVWALVGILARMSILVGMSKCCWILVLRWDIYDEI